MSLEVLPDHVLLHVLARLQACEAVAISQTCSRLQRLALQSPVNSPTALPGCQDVPISAVVAAAGQRMHVVTGGTWRDALLLSAWQRQQTSASPHRARRISRVGFGARDPSTHVSSNSSPLLQQVLGVPDAAAAAIAGDVPLPGGSVSCGAAARVDSGGPAASSTGRRPLTEFGLYWQPDAQQLAQAGCLVMDGSAAVLLQNLPAATAATGAAQGHATAAAAAQTHTSAAGGGCVSANATTAAGEQAGSYVASTLGQPMHGQLSLLQGHLPPAQDSSDMPLHKQLLFPLGHAMGSSSNSKGGDTHPRSSTQPTSYDWGPYGHLARLRPLLQYLQAWWRQADSAASNTSHNSGAGEVAAGQAAAVNSSSSSSSKAVVAGVYSGPRQAFLLPSQPPPGSIPGLVSPWPPVLSAGGTYLGLGQPGCDVTAGSRSCPRLLRDALLHNEPALLLPAGPTGLHEVPSLNARFYAPPAPWQAQLCHLDVSGQVALSDEDLGMSLNSCSNLVSLSIADTAAGAITFMMWPHRQPASGTQAAAAAAAVPAAGQTATAGPAGTGSAGGGCVATQSAQARLAAMQIAALATAATRNSSRSTAGTGATTSSSNQAVGATPSIPLTVRSSMPCCPLRVLDVSGCPALTAASGASVFKIFQASLATMTSLEGLLACRLNADAVFHCTCGSQQAAALAAAPAATASPAVKAAPSCVSGPLPDQQHISCRFCQVLSGLLELDVCGSTALSAHTLARLLNSCSSLRRLGVAGCKTLGVHDGVNCLEAGLLSMAQVQHAQRIQQQQQGQAQLSAGCAANYSSLVALALEPEPPSRATSTSTISSSSNSSTWHPPVCTVGGGLQRLCVGWGWSAAAISCVLRGSPFLVSFTAGVGACATDEVLQQLASSCPHLQSLCLTMCTVSSTGVAAVLQGCPHLTTLQLQQCVGPFSGAEMLPSQSMQQEQQRQQRRWQLSTLQLSGPQTVCSDDQLLQLLGLAVQPPDTTAPAANNTASSSSAASGIPPVSRECRPTCCAAAYLTALCLVRVQGLTDGLLLDLSAAGCRLQHLRLQHCYTTHTHSHRHVLTDSAAAAAAGSSTCCGFTQSGGSGQQVVSFSSAALLQLVEGSCALSLRSLALRHAVALPPDFVAGLVQRAPLLQRLVLDACDLPGGFDLEPDLHAALTVIHVARCHSVDGHHSSMGSDSAHIRDNTAAAADSRETPGRLVDRDLVVHMLALRRTLHLPAG